MRWLASIVTGVAAVLAAAVGVRRGLQPPERDDAEREERDQKKHTLRVLITGLLVVALVGLAVLLSGIVPNRASDPHTAPVEFFLALATRQSVATHSLGLEPPDLNDPARILRGAGHYQTGCAHCHGAPGNARPPIGVAMMPPPPWLPEVVGQWKPRELFYIVKHGIKFAGMPAWPVAGRDDEVWSVVAFLVQLPSMDGSTWRQLARGRGAVPAGPAGTEDAAASADRLGAIGGAEDPPPMIDACARCHGVEGHGRGNAAFPRLAGQREAYLLASLQAYASRARPSGIMGPVAVALQPEDARALARWYATRAPLQASDPVDPTLAARGETIARNGIPARRIPSCVDCHGPFQHDEGVRPIYPRLAGQYAGYLELQLELFRSGERGGTAWHQVMGHVGADLGDEEIRALAAWYAGLPGDGPALPQQRTTPDKP